MRKDIERWNEMRQRILADAYLKLHTRMELLRMLDFLFDEIEAMKGGAQRCE
jgi:hypothetical protein